MSDNPAHSKLWYIQQLDPFQHMHKDDYAQIDKNSFMREVKKGETLYMEGTADKNIYMLKSGAVKITKVTPEGKEVIVDILKPGAIFGEVPMTDSGLKEETAEVIENGLICTMRKEYFDNAVKNIPELSANVSKIMGLRRYKLQNKLMDLLYSTVDQRLARTILHLKEDFGEQHDGGVLIRIKLTHMDYAALIASTRETVTVALNKLRGEGVIDFEGKHVVVKDEDNLKARAV